MRFPHGAQRAEIVPVAVGNLPVDSVTPLERQILETTPRLESEISRNLTITPMSGTTEVITKAVCVLYMRHHHDPVAGHVHIHFQCMAAGRNGAFEGAEGVFWESGFVASMGDDLGEVIALT